MGKTKRGSAAVAAPAAKEERPKRAKKEKHDQEAAAAPAKVKAAAARPARGGATGGAGKDAKQHGDAKSKKKQPASKKQQQPEPEPEEAEEQEDVSEQEQELEEQESDQDGAGGGPDAERVHEVFMREVAAKEEELNKHCVILEQCEADEDEVTLDELRSLKRIFVPNQVQEDFIEVWSELDQVGVTDDEDDEGQDEDDDGAEPDVLQAIMKAMLGGKMLVTRHASVMHDILGSHLTAVDKLIKAKKWDKAFCRWAATLIAARREQHWYEDTDMPADAEAVYSKLRSQWLKLRTHSDAELGGLLAEGGGDAKGELTSYLQGLADDMRPMDYAVEDVA